MSDNHVASIKVPPCLQEAHSPQRLNMRSCTHCNAPGPLVYSRDLCLTVAIGARERVIENLVGHQCQTCWTVDYDLASHHRRHAEADQFRLEVERELGTLTA